MASMRRLRLLAREPEPVVLGAALAGLAGGGVAELAGAGWAAGLTWTAATALGTALALAAVGAGLRHRQPGVDLVALLALVGALAVGEPLAGSVLTLMFAGGRSLEAAAGRRATRDLSTLLSRAPRWANRVGDGRLVRCAAEEVVVGDRLVVRGGEPVPVDGLLLSPAAVLDESTLTGEPMPVERSAGDAVRSGVLNAGTPFELRATSTAEQSSYAAIVRLVRQAGAGSAPFVRLANRYAAVFVPVTLAMAGLAWLVGGSPVRAVAVLVVATPCPLILAAPVAVVSGMSRAARRGVVVKDGAALERLAAGRTLLFDKTGTLTAGRPTLLGVASAPGWPAAEVLAPAAAVDQFSPHVLARALVQAATDRGLPLAPVADPAEAPGQGIAGTVGGRRVAVGRAGFAATDSPAWARAARRRAGREDVITATVGIDGRTAGVLLFDDPVRPDAAATVRRLRAAGIARLVLLTGDRQVVADGVAAALGLDDVAAERSPAEKVDVVRAETGQAPTIMVGDGINDAPALAAATVGVALAGHGATASAEAADVVLTVDRLDRLADAVQIARRSGRIARQSVLAGMSLSFAGMAVAAAGLLAPVFGAVAQEAIDVAVILNALRALRVAPVLGQRLAGAAAELTARFAAEHRPLRPRLEELRSLADVADELAPGSLIERARGLQRFLEDTLYPHELAEEHELYPALAVTLGPDATATMSRAHREIGHHIRRLGRLLDDIGAGEPDEEDVREIRRRLYGLHAILRLHFAQEEEGYFTLADEPRRPDAAARP